MYIGFCLENKRKISIEIAMEFIGAPYHVFRDQRTMELLKLYTASKQNPISLFGPLNETPAIWVEVCSMLNRIDNGKDN